MEDALVMLIRRTLWQYEADVLHPNLTPEQRARRVSHIRAVLEKMPAGGN